ncbi:uncharacterized protein DUF3866 [Brevibacterium sanguinis]|uniref:Uncharacterized protein DUF3866 n=2 Tax=Brevibacterium TaxID=1696 RepID=A0A366IL65_9MICO|nr:MULTISPECIES: DUF3866 family protein [Brevibacterium]RBP64702.1 uncharacterized protein DUF3866 [Brevibacterium sanguinis]RBP71655.1 uncharacterized protein DUF3866 [Brevibacterium celere]
MIHWRKGIVTAIRSRRPGCTEIEAELDKALPGSDTVDIRAIAYTEAVGDPQVGDVVLLNVSALAKRLGTGGFGLVAALPEALPADPPPGPGHLVKDRYSPLQTMVLGVDDQESEHHATLAAAQSLESMPVLVADLHSAVPAIIAGIRAEAPAARIVYVLSDGAALPAAFSQALAGLKEAGWLAGSISTGQSWGGDLEAVTIHTGLLAARHVLAADVAIVAQGPGNLGTGTKYGFSGLVVGDHLNAAALLGGRPVGVLRMSNADARGRHFGISHHSLTTLAEVARPGVRVPVPDFTTLSATEIAEMDSDPNELAEVTAGQLERLSMHDLVDVDLRGLWPALRACPVRLSTMGRRLPADAAAFLAAAAAGSSALRP